MRTAILLAALLAAAIQPPAPAPAGPAPAQPAAIAATSPQPASPAADIYTPTPLPPIAQFPYQPFTTTDRFGRQITFYLSKAPSPEAALPLIVCVQGSGSQSVFLEVDTPTGKRIASGGPEAIMLSLARDRARILVVEKPGVDFCIQPARPGSAEEGSETFRREHTLERWTEALNAAITATLTLPGVDPSRVLAVGHSEGGQVVCHLGALNPRITHIATLAGGGPTQLFDLFELARSGAMGPPTGTAADRTAWLERGWREVQAEPDSFDKLWLGHPHRRWSSFLETSPIEALHKTSARIFIAQGTADTATLPASADALYAELLARGRDVIYERIEGGDHAFRTASDPDGWKRVHARVLEWFLGS